MTGSNANPERADFARAGGHAGHHHHHHRRPAFSLLGLSVVARLGFVAAASAILWLAIAWALA